MQKKRHSVGLFVCCSRQFECVVCGSSFKSRRLLDRHIQSCRHFISSLRAAVPTKQWCLFKRNNRVLFLIARSRHFTPIISNDRLSLQKQSAVLDVDRFWTLHNSTNLLNLCFFILNTTKSPYRPIFAFSAVILLAGR